MSGLITKYLNLNSVSLLDILILIISVDSSESGAAVWEGNQQLSWFFPCYQNLFYIDLQSIKTFFICEQNCLFA